MKFNLVASIALLFTVLGSVSAQVPNAIKPIEPNDFCDQSGKLTANGTQIKEESCNSLFIGEIPSVENMVSCLIISPRNGQSIQRNVPFNVTIKLQGIETAFFSDPVMDYYEIPQTLNDDGIIQGHSHVTIQKIDGRNAPNPNIFAFFKGLNGKDNNGVLTQAVDKGLPQRGLYRICTMNSSNSHQPVVMPVAQRGSQDDCIRVNVV